MRKEYTSVRGIVATEPKILKDYLSRKKEVLFFTLTFKQKREDGKHEQVKVNIVVKEKTCKNGLEVLTFLKKWVRRGDILRLWGYTQYVRFKHTKPIKCLRVIKFKYFWCNTLLNREIQSKIKGYQIINNPSEHPKEISNIRENLKERYKSGALYSFLFSSIGKPPRYKNQKEKYSSLVFLMKCNKSEALESIKEGNLYNAMACIWLNRYIYTYDMPRNSKKDFKNNYANLLEMGFKIHDKQP